MTKILLMMTFVSYFKTIITTVSLNTARLSLNTTEIQYPHFKRITFTKAISQKILLNYYC
jgi:hypothetical protein